MAEIRTREQRRINATNDDRGRTTRSRFETGANLAGRLSDEPTVARNRHVVVQQNQLGIARLRRRG
jgi:hypothetical protein